MGEERADTVLRGLQFIEESLGHNTTWDTVLRRHRWYGPQTAAQISPHDPKPREKLESALACIPEPEGSASPQ